jgi:hypothetical protein
MTRDCVMALRGERGLGTRTQRRLLSHPTEDFCRDLHIWSVEVKDGAPRHVLSACPLSSGPLLLLPSSNPKDTWQQCSSDGTTHGGCLLGQSRTALFSREGSHTFLLSVPFSASLWPDQFLLLYRILRSWGWKDPYCPHPVSSPGGAEDAR